MSAWEPVIGLECHVQLATATKAFSAARAAFGGAPNSRTDPYTLALPGTLPVLNRAAVEAAVTLARAARCTLRRTSRFARKHYFYPDLPKGYQITQYDEPIAEGGAIDVLAEGERRSVPLTRIHLEEDAGKNLHVAGGTTSLVDLNRAGVALAEVVTAPAIGSPSAAGDYLRALRQLVRWLGICDGNMEEGSLRCDANVSLRPAGARTLGTRVELKNLNSFKHVERAIAYEIARQAEVLERGLPVLQETRLWDDGRGTSHGMRSKEEAADYRYFPEPDLPPLRIDEAMERIPLPELPFDRRARLIERLGLPAHDADVITAEREIADWYERVIEHGVDPKKAANWVTGELLRLRSGDERPLSAIPVQPAGLAELIGLVEGGALSGKMAKEVFERMYASGRGARELVESAGLAQLSDEGRLEEAVRQAVAAHPGQAAKYRAGNQKLLGFFVGQVMGATEGRANPEMVNRIARKVLSE